MHVNNGIKRAKKVFFCGVILCNINILISNFACYRLCLILYLHFHVCIYLCHFIIVVVVQLHVIFCDPMDCSTPHLPVLHNLPEFSQTPVCLVDDAIQLISSSVATFSSCSQSFPGSFPMSRLLASGGQSIGTLASKSVLPMNILC